VTGGLGAGSQPEVGRAAAEEAYRHDEQARRAGEYEKSV